MTLKELDSHEFLWNVHCYLNEYIRFADTKAQVVIGWTSALLGVLIAAGFHRQIDQSLLGGIRTVGLGLLIGAFVAAFLTIVPRLNTNRAKGFIYWGSILGHPDRFDFVAQFNHQSDKELHEHLIHHVFELAEIAKAKYLFVGASLWFAFIGSALCGIIYLFP